MKKLLIVLVLLAALPARAEDVHVAAASDLNFALKEIIQDFEHSTGNKVLLSLGSSGNFFAQIQNGAPFDNTAATRSPGSTPRATNARASRSTSGAMPAAVRTCVLSRAWLWSVRRVG